MSSDQPPISKQTYNQSLKGVLGELGAGADAQILFLQSALRPVELVRTTLINEIPGSEAWPIRDLFQREIDTRRVTKQLLPYLRDPNKLKFFNPLTLTVLPVNPATGEVESTIPAIRDQDTVEDGRSWVTAEVPELYRFRHPKDHPEWAQLDWSDTRVRLVAIDGQHRLSALKRMLADNHDRESHEKFLRWSIPIVVLGFRSAREDRHTVTVLEAVRSIFIYINREARVPNETRTILLTDESINAIATQELVQISHQNDLMDEETRRSDCLPLPFFDWRGEEEDGRPLPAQGAIKSVDEVNLWFRRYLLGTDFSEEQAIRLDIQPLDPLSSIFLEKRLDPAKTQLVREALRERVLPGVSFALEHFEPYRQYSDGLRKLEHAYLAQSDTARHAFYQLRFGSNRAPDHLQTNVRALFDELVEKLNSLKAEHIPDRLLLDIGMRGVMCALGISKELLSSWLRRTVVWKEVSEWFTESLNRAYGAHWFDGKDRLALGLLRHITEDHNGTVVNYRPEDARDALGCLVLLLVSSYGAAARSIPGPAELQELRDRELEILESTLVRGYKKEVRPMLRENYPSGGKPLTDAVAAEAAKRAKQHIHKLERVLKKIA